MLPPPERYLLRPTDGRGETTVLNLGALPLCLYVFSFEMGISIRWWNGH